MLNAVPASWDFSVCHGGMYDVEWRVNWKRHINKGKAIGSTLKILYFMVCEMPSSQHLDVIWAEMLFTNFFVVHNIALSAANHARHLAHVSRKLNWRTIYTSLKIKLLCLKSDFATLKSSEWVGSSVYWMLNEDWNEKKRKCFPCNMMKFLRVCRLHDTDVCSEEFSS